MHMRPWDEGLSALQLQVVWHLFYREIVFQNLRLRSGLQQRKVS